MVNRGGLAAKAIERALWWMKAAARRSAAVPRADPTDPVACFADAAGSNALLDVEEERAIFDQLLGNTPPLTDRSPSPIEIHAARVGALQRLVAANLCLVASTVARLVHHHPQLHADMLQEGVLGLYRALRRFDPQRGARFSTYAVWWVYQHMLRLIARDELIVRLPSDMHAALMRVRRMRAEFELAKPHAEKDASADYARDLGVSRQTAAMLLEVDEGTVPLEWDHPTIGGDGPSQHLIDPKAVDPARNAIERSLRDAFDACLAEIEPRSRQIIEWRFGFGGEDQLTLEEVGNRLGLTRERVRQLETSPSSAVPDDFRQSAARKPSNDAGHPLESACSANQLG